MESAPEKGAKQRWIEIAERVVPLLLTIMIPMAGGLWAVYVFLENQRELAAKREVEIHSQARTRFLELQKPLIDQQFATYNEFIRVIGDLLATDVTEVGGEQWRRSESDYWKLHWSRVALVEDDKVHESKRRFAKALREYTENVLARDRVIDKLAETDRKLEKVDEKLKAYSLLKEGEQNELDAERTRLKREADTLRAELHKLRSAFEEASVPLTSALRRSIQRSWTGEFGK